MRLSRRRFLEAAAAAACMAATRLPAAAGTGATYRLDIKPGSANLLEDAGLATRIWGYDGRVPGPLLRARRGRPLEITVNNLLDQPTTVHWHGLRIDNAMDGVPGLTQEPIAPGAGFTYRFTPPDAGTYWYHPHARSWEQVARGLYGTLVVEEDAPPDFDRDFVLIADDWRLGEDGAFDAESLGNLHDWAHAGRLGNILTLNGKAYERLPVAPGDRIRLRLINTATARVMRFGLADRKAWIVAHDGQPVLPRLTAEDGIELSPGQRADLVVDIADDTGTEIPIVETSTSERLVAGYLVVGEATGRKQRSDEVPPALPANPVPPVTAESFQDVNLTMTGGAMRFLESAVYKGETLDGRTLALEHKQVWAFNGVAGMPAAPLFTAERGAPVKIRLRNDTLWPHNIHLHGHHFTELDRRRSSDEGAVVLETARGSALQDTVLLQAGELSEIAFLADNPGRWMIHCHMLEHQASGMATWFEVT